MHRRGIFPVLPSLVFPSFHFEDFLFSFMGFPRPSFTFFPVPFYREEVEEKEYDIEVKKNGTDVVVRSKVIFI